MSMETKTMQTKSRHTHTASENPTTQRDSTTVPEPVTAADRIVLEIRKFIAAAIFFNTQAADKVGLGLTDMQMLHMLQLYGPSTPSRLAVWTGLSSGGVTVALDRLEKASYIRREPNPSDRRSLLVTLVPARMRKIAGLYEGVESETRRLLTTLPHHDLEAVIHFFETMRVARKESKALLHPQPRTRKLVRLRPAENELGR
jgi:MarR family transcriptional regulator, organic hydroperoxide resistance regulator